jgi:flagellar biosynthesis protein FlhB
MSGESQDRKTEEPTDRRLEEAREEGQVARSRDVNTAVIVGVVLLAIWMARDALAGRARDLAAFALDAPAALREGSPARVLELTEIALHKIAVLCLPPVLLAIGAGVLVSMMQTRGLFAPAAMRPQAERMNPIEGLKEIFSKRSAVEFFKALVKIMILGFAMALIIRTSLPTLVKMPNLPVAGVAEVTAIVFARFFGLAVLTLSLVAAFDMWFQRIDYRYRLRMTREEVKRERRDNEGDPMMRARRRTLAQQAGEESGLDRVRHASLVLHASGDKLAVALYADRAEGGAIWLLHKGTGHVAAAIVATANGARVRVVADANLARAVYQQTAIDADVAARLARDVRRLFV